MVHGLKRVFIGVAVFLVLALAWTLVMPKSKILNPPTIVVEKTNPPKVQPPHVVSTDNRGAVARVWDSATSVFAGQCSVRSQEVTLTSEWLSINQKDDIKAGTKECLVVWGYSPGTVVEAKGAGKPFQLGSGLMKDQHIYEVRLVSGDAKFTYSLCPKSLNGKLLNWDCTERKTAQR
jgi:hypothetical protein